MRAYLHAATALAIELDHPAYDCIYVALAMARGCVFATADRRLVRKSRQVARSEVAAVIVDLPEAAASI
jgi:predicted nucleic acid-binding protein